MIQSVIQNFQNNLDQLIHEIELYNNEDDLWIVEEGISNSAGNLALHLIGNLKHFIGAVVGGTGYKRERDKEFSNKNIPRETILRELHETKEVIATSLNKLTDAALETEFPVTIPNHQGTAGFQLIRLVGHLNYHLGQINYHRRLLAAN